MRWVATAADPQPQRIRGGFSSPRPLALDHRVARAAGGGESQSAFQLLSQVFDFAA